MFTDQQLVESALWRYDASRCSILDLIPQHQEIVRFVLKVVKGDRVKLQWNKSNPVWQVVHSDGVEAIIAKDRGCTEFKVPIGVLELVEKAESGASLS